MVNVTPVPTTNVPPTNCAVLLTAIGVFRYVVPGPYSARPGDPNKVSALALPAGLLIVHVPLPPIARVLNV